VTVLLYPREGKTPALLAADRLAMLFSVPNSKWLGGRDKLYGGIVTHAGPEEPVGVVMPSRLGSKRNFLQQLFGRKNRETCAAEQIFAHGLTGRRQSSWQHDNGRFAPLDETARDDGILERGLLCDAQLGVELAWKPFVVVVEKGDPSTSRCVDPSLRASAGPTLRGNGLIASLESSIAPRACIVASSGASTTTTTSIV
jgi:hypothetical protein